VHGFNPKVIEEFLTGMISPVYNIDNYAKVVRYQLEIAHKRAREMIEAEKVRLRNNNPLIVKPGDLIYLKIGNRNKFDPSVRTKITKIGNTDFSRNFFY
jgi:hypothetical protein